MDREPAVVVRCAAPRPERAMSLILVTHHPAEPPGSPAATACRAALRDAVWDVAESLWAVGEEALLAASDLSPG